MSFYKAAVKQCILRNDYTQSLKLTFGHPCQWPVNWENLLAMKLYRYYIKKKKLGNSQLILVKLYFKVSELVAF